jgi:hypothetical protein
MHLDAGYDSAKTRDLLDCLGYEAEIAAKGKPAPIQASKRWPVERTKCAARRSVVSAISVGRDSEEHPWV